MTVSDRTYAENVPRYTVHVQGNGSTGFARDMFHTNTLAEAKEKLLQFAKGTDARADSETPGAWADVYGYQPNDTVHASHGDYPLLRYETGPRGGVRRVTV